MAAGMIRSASWLCSVICLGRAGGPRREITATRQLLLSPRELEALLLERLRRRAMKRSPQRRLWYAIASAEVAALDANPALKAAGARATFMRMVDEGYARHHGGGPASRPKPTGARMPRADAGRPAGAVFSAPAP